MGDVATPGIKGRFNSTASIETLFLTMWRMACYRESSACQTSHNNWPWKGIILPGENTGCRLYDTCKQLLVRSLYLGKIIPIDNTFFLQCRYRLQNYYKKYLLPYQMSFLGWAYPLLAWDHHQCKNIPCVRQKSEAAAPVLLNLHYRDNVSKTLPNIVPIRWNLYN